MTTRWLARTALGILLSIGVATTALAQYGGGTTGGTGGTTGTYTAPKGGYGAGTAIGIAGGAAAAAIALFVIHHRHATQGEEASVAGCTEQANGVTTLVDDSTKTTYSLTSLSKDVKPGERVELSGRKSQNASGKNVFHVQKLVKDDGPCTPQTASVGADSNP
jgi:hypothetical protein